MIVGCPKEIKNEEYRVGMTPNGVKDFVNAGHTVIVEAGGGVGSGFSDAEYKAAGAKMAPVEDVFAKADMIYKVKEPLPQEWPMFKPGQILYTYLHLAAAYAKDLTKGMLKADIRGIAFETVELPNGAHPLLFPMSEVAGKLAIQAGATHLQKNNGGRGVLLGGVTGVPQGQGRHHRRRHRGHQRRQGGRRHGRAHRHDGHVRSAPHVPRRRLRRRGRDRALHRGGHRRADQGRRHRRRRRAAAGRRPGPAPGQEGAGSRTCSRARVIVDVAIDQGGCFETSKPTTHSEPTYVVDGVIHYCVANMPGAVARTSTMALAGATLPYGLAIANKGFEQAVKDDAALALGVNVYGGKLTIPSVAEAHKMKYTPLDKVLA